MMNYLVVFMHPSKDSFNGSILENVVATIKDKKAEVRVRNLAEQSFHPHLSREEYKESYQRYYKTDVVKEQNFIKWADHIIFIFPVWWGGFPAIGKGFIDRVFSFGFAYELEGENPIPKLVGKKASLLYTTGAPKEEFENSGMNEAMLRLIDQSILQFCGLSLDGSLHFGNVIQGTDLERKNMLIDTIDFINTI
ncbi:NAD(P)H-dependent oxidoreductase [Salipaludibacillus sp. CF4.18]|uniref:NAD(P)H-dependent oxidoreductase n=1 Tax=Salipaludibacillus sp. CF4.18 TaxID=3373081 RepID=UPI003EE63A6A